MYERAGTGVCGLHVPTWVCVCVSETGRKEGGRAIKLHLTCQGLGLLRPRALVKADRDQNGLRI